MNKDNLNKAKEILINELNNSMKEQGTDWFHRLAVIIGELQVLTQILDNPDKVEKRKRMFE